MKRSLALFFSCIALLSLLSGCNMSDPIEDEPEYFDEETSEEDASRLLISDFSLPVYSGATLDPILCSDGVQQTLSALLYEGLFALNPSFEAEPRLCESYTYDAEHYTYRFTLRENVRFCDGSALTARDVIAGFRRAEESKRYRARFRTVSSYYADGTNGVILTLNCDNAAFPALLDIPIIKAGTEQQTVPPGTGPYLYIAKSEGDYLLANDSWWGGEVSLPQIPLVPVKDEDAASYRFSGSEIQLLVAELSGQSQVSTAGQIRITDAPSTTLQYLGFRDEGLFSSIALRKALSMGIRRQELTRGYLSGHALATEFPVSPDSPLYPASLAVGYNAAAFAAAMNKLGYELTDEQKHTVRLIVPEGNDYKLSIAESVAELLQPYGIVVTVKPLPWADYLEALQTDAYDIYYATVRLTADWDLRPLLGSYGSLNYGHYSSEETDALLLGYLSSPGAATMEQLSRKLQEDMPIVPLFFQSVSVLTQTQVLSSLTPTAVNPFYDMAQWELHLDPK